MDAEPILLSPEEKLETLRALDIFHRWQSIDEKRTCRRCGQTITGREIKVIRSGRGQGSLRLECPTEGCPSVPLEWMVLDPPVEPKPAVAATEPVAEDEKLGQRGKSNLTRSPNRGVFGFLRVPRALF
ncbi:MAG: hypothetical protein ABI540_09975 [Spartobacteria bacterium]